MEKVRQGETASIKAATWNAFVDAANYVKEARQNRAAHGVSAELDVGIVRIKNGESSTYDRFSALVITGVCVTAETNEDEFTSCPPVFEGLKMTSNREGKPYAVLLEPIAAGEIGRAMVLGVTPAKVAINSTDEDYAVPRRTLRPARWNRPRPGSPASSGGREERVSNGASCSSAALEPDRPMTRLSCAR